MKSRRFFVPLLAGVLLVIAATLALFSMPTPHIDAQGDGTAIIQTAAQETVNAILTGEPRTTPTTAATFEFGAAFTVIVYHDQDSLTLLIVGEQRVSLRGFTIAVENSGEIKLENYSILRDLGLNALQTPICIHLELADTPRDVSEACLDNNPVIRTINEADGIWYNDLSDTVLGVQILRDETLMQPPCLNAGVACPVQFIPYPIANMPNATPGGDLTVTGTLYLDGYENRGFLRSDICVAEGSEIEIRASGVVGVGQYVGSVDPDGTDTGFMGLPLGDSYDLERQFPHGALLCRVQGEEDWRYCGRELQFAAETSGCLEFQLNDNDTLNNSGEFEIRFEVR